MIRRERPVICQIVHSLDVGGAEILARSFAEESAGEFTTVFACLDAMGTMADAVRREGYEVELLSRRPGFDYRVARRLAAFCRRNRVSLIHAHQYAPFFYAALSRAPFRRPPILFTEHGRDFPDYPRPKRIWANKLMLGKYDRVVAVGEHVRQALIENEGIPRHRVNVIYNGAHLKGASSATSRETLREELGLGESDVAVLQVARLNHLKDHATAIRAMARLIASHPGIRLLIAGEGEKRSTIQQMISEAGLADTVQLLGHREDIPRLLRAGDIALLTSISEGIPLTMIEAMAASVPCVSTDVGGVSEVVVHEKTGLLANAGDDTTIARHLVELAENPGKRRALGQGGCTRSHELFSDRKMHEAYRGIYHEMLASVKQ